MADDKDPEDAVEQTKGKVKEAAGVLTGSDDLEKEGEQQQKKVAAEEKAEQKEAEAQKARAQASGHEAEQKKR